MTAGDQQPDQPTPRADCGCGRGADCGFHALGLLDPVDTSTEGGTS